MSRAGGGRVGLVQVPVGVGGADDPVPAPRDDEQHATSRCAGSARCSEWIRSRGHDQVHALGRPHVELAAPADQLLDVVGPHAGGVDHLLGPYVDTRAPDSRSRTRTPVTRSPSRRKPDDRARVATCAP